MSIFYNKDTQGFYDDRVINQTIPPGSVEITSQQHSDLLDAQTQGKEIYAQQDGSPTSRDWVVTSAALILQINAEADNRKNALSSSEQSIALLIGCGVVIEKFINSQTLSSDDTNLLAQNTSLSNDLDAVEAKSIQFQTDVQAMTQTQLDAVVVSDDANWLSL